jgi:Transposase IS116/IS110/IS902 family
MVGKVKFEARIKELVENQPDLAELIEPLLIVRRALREQIVVLHRRLLAIVRDDEVCRRLMTTPGVGPVVALTYRASVDVPARFRKSKAVGAVFGLTCSKYQSGMEWKCFQPFLTPFSTLPIRTSRTQADNQTNTNPNKRNGFRVLLPNDGHPGTPLLDP